MAIGYKNYRIRYDYHTHTVFSHGKGTIEDNARVAFDKGLAGIGISDHGPGHLLYGINRKKCKKMREEVSRAKTLFPQLEIFLSIEANLVHTENGLDITREECKEYDFVIAGYHFGVQKGDCSKNFIHNKSRISLPGKRSLMSRNTDMALRAIYENPIKLLTHPGDKGPFDLLEIAKACVERGTLLEINAHHAHLSVEEIKRVAGKTDVLFAVSSDAHMASNVGSCAQAIKRAMDAGIDMSRIVNIESY